MMHCLNDFPLYFFTSGGVNGDDVERYQSPTTLDTRLLPRPVTYLLKPCCVWNTQCEKADVWIANLCKE